MQFVNDSKAEVLSIAVGLDGDGPCEVPRAAADRLGFLLVALGGRLEVLAEERLAEIGLDGYDYTLLAILSVDGPGTQAELANLMGKAPGVIVAAVDQAEAKGLVERKRDPADRRRSRVTPTRQGLSALTKADKLADALVAQALSGLDDSGLEALRGLLRRGLALEA